MTRRALVTGAAGFVGRWVTRALAGQGGWTVTGAGLGSHPAPDEVDWQHADLRVPDDVAALLDRTAPDLVIHLAGIAYLPAAAADPGQAYEVNVAATGRLLGELRRRRAAGTLDPTVLVVGSGEQYGRHDASGGPLREEASQLPRNVYAASKTAQEVVALEAARSDGLRVVCTRSFNHSGAGQSPQFLLPALVERALALPRGGGALRLGNTTPVRDYLHVADVAAAYLALADTGEAGTAYNVCSGQGTSVAELAARVLARAGRQATITPDPALVRPADIPWLVGDNSRLRERTGWAPARSLDDIIDDLIHAATR